MSERLRAALESKLDKKIYVDTLYWACQGLINKEIGEKVFRSRQCIAFRFDQMAKKFGANNRRALLRKILGYEIVNCRSLTLKRQQILVMLSKGYKTIEIAKELSLDKSTVKFHTTEMRRNIGAKSNLHMIAIYWELMA